MKSSKPIKWTIALVAVFGLVGFSESETRKKGYWWGEPYQTEEEQEQQEEEKSKEQERELPPAPPMSELMKMHPEEIRELEKKYLDYALWKLTPEATAQYYTIIKAVRLKSKAFAATHGVVKMTNPELSTSFELPQMAAGRAARKRDTENSIKEQLDQYNDEYGLIMFTSKGCSYCQSQRVLLGEMRNRYGIEFSEIDVDQYADMALQFGVKNTPTTIMVKRNTPNWMPIAFGLQSLPVLRDNAYRSILLMEKQINPNQFYTPPNMLGTNLDPSQHEQQ